MFNLIELLQNPLPTQQLIKRPRVIVNLNRHFNIVIVQLQAEKLPVHNLASQLPEFMEKVHGDSRAPIRVTQVFPNCLLNSHYLRRQQQVRNQE